MKRKVFCTAVIGFSAVWLMEIFYCSSPIAGNGSQTPNSHTAMVYNPGGTPAANACVRFYPRDRDPRPGYDTSAVDSTRTDANGNYSDPLPTGTYNIIATGDSGWAYEDSISATTGTPVKPPACTLKTPGTIRGVVQLEQCGDSRTVLILFLGTHTFTAPDDSAGNFTTDSMAGGRYRVRILTTLPDYQVLDTILTVIAGTQNVLPQPIILHYTGIPIPNGLSATYDTVHGIVTVRWNSVTFQKLQGYIVYRNDTSTTVPQQISGNTAITDTFYYDTVFLDLFDTNTFVFEYRVKVQDTNANIGNKFSAPCEVTAASPTEVRTFINLQTLNTINDTASINDSVKIIVLYQNQTRMSSRISWCVEKSDSLVKETNISSLAGSDTLICVWRTPGDNKVFVKIQDTAGTVWEDSLIVTIVLDAPVANAGKDTTVRRNCQVILHGSTTQQFGRIITWEWDIANAGFVETSSSDTTITTPDSVISAYPCIIRVTDDDGNVAKDTIILKVGVPAPVLTHPINGDSIFISFNSPEVFLWHTIYGPYKPFFVQISSDTGFSVVFVDTCITEGRGNESFLHYYIYYFLHANITYYWRVRALDFVTGISSEWSKTEFFTTRGYAWMSPPELLSPANGATGVSVTPQLQWSPSATTMPPVASYHFQISTGNFVTGIIDTGAVDSSFQEVQIMKPLQPGTCYYWRVYPVSDTMYKGPGGCSEVWSFTTVP